MNGRHGVHLPQHLGWFLDEFAAFRGQISLGDFLLISHSSGLAGRSLEKAKSDQKIN